MIILCKSLDWCKLVLQVKLVFLSRFATGTELRGICALFDLAFARYGNTTEFIMLNVRSPILNITISNGRKFSFKARFIPFLFYHVIV